MKKYYHGLLFVAAAIRLSAQIEVVSGGNVGIGTVSPGSKLDVFGGTIRVSTAGTNAAFVEGGPSDAYFGNTGTGRASFGNAENWQTLVADGGNVGIGTVSPQYKLDVNGQLHGLYLWAGGNPTGGTAADGRVYVANSSGVTKTYFDAAGDSYVAGGNLGIGTTAPTEARLVVNDTTGTAVELLSLRSAYNSPSGAKSLTWRDTTNIVGQIDVSYTSPTAKMAFGHLYNSGYQAGELMTILGTGNVGIGTTTPGYKLEVSGSVRATSFISNSTTYADFVFKADYQLPSLAETEAAIQRDGHLPGIPSEAEAAAHGIDLSAMQVKLLQKVEEMTLHLIAQEKEITALKKRVTELQSGKSQ